IDKWLLCPTTTYMNHNLPQHYSENTEPTGVGPDNYTLDYNECYFNFCECCPPERGPRGSKGERGSAGIKLNEVVNGIILHKNTLSNAVCVAFKNNRFCTLLISMNLSGEKGERGHPGTSGPPGIPGKPAQKGEAGLKGEKGDVGFQGVKGKQGEKGDHGQNGTAGEKGEPGLEGPVGPPGTAMGQGPKGEKGDKGDCGIFGERGPKGDRGETGAPGDPGHPGPPGEPGVSGPQGPQGIRGMPGPKGDRGYPGIRGERGFRGLKGAKGSGMLQKRSAFSVGISPKKSFPPSGFPIRFDKIFYNEENHFNMSSNSFTCVHPGVYVFSFHITVRNQPLRATLVVNGLRKVRTRDSLYGQDIDQASTLVVLRLAAGDQVWMETFRDWNGVYASSEDDSIFSGFLLYSDKA
uniref:Otolin 1b n=1 Tax=Xiphophorus couchianus TaxID=32473 RepID=A0A3B5LZG3_9TELE